MALFAASGDGLRQWSKGRTLDVGSFPAPAVAQVLHDVDAVPGSR